jgi:ligand-binding sensor domain-containing protein
MFKFFSLLIACITTAITFVNAQTNYTYTNFTTANGLPHNNIKCVAADNSGNIWFGSTAGLTKYNGTTMTTYTTTNGLPDNNVNRIVVAQNGDILIATNNGLSRYNGATFTNSLTGNIIRTVFEAANGNLWAGTSGGGVKRYTTTWTTYTTSNGIPHNFVNTITQDLNGNIWIGTSEGLARFNGTTWTTFTNINGLNNEADQVISSHCDNNGILWFGSKPSFNIGGGVTRYNGTTFTHFNTPEGLAGKQIEDMTADPKNRKWFASFTSGISYFKDDNYPQYSFTTLNTLGGLISNQVQGVAVDGNGYVWFATISGVSRLTPVKINSLTFVDAKCNTNFEGSVTVNVAGLNTLYYSIDNGLNFQATNSFQGLQPGVYNVIITDSIFTMTTPDDTISVIDPISPGLPDSLSLCFNDSVQISVTNQGSNYNWQPALFFNSSAIHNPYASPPVSQYVYLSMDDANGCVVVDSTYITVKELTPMTLNVNGNVFTCIGDFVSYKWTYYDNVIPGVFTNIYAATQPGIYGVHATDSRGCTTYSGMIHYLNADIKEIVQKPEFVVKVTENSVIVDIINYDVNTDKIHLKLYDVTGKIISQPIAYHIANRIYRVEIPTWQIGNGIYVLNIPGTAIREKFAFVK